MKTLAAILFLACLAGCATQTGRTAAAVDCSRMDVDILDSVYKRQGSTTTWCAKCKDKVYRCVSNAQKTQLQCREAVPEDGCR